jgi:dihydrofolate reductase
MTKLIYSMSVSLDGYVAGPGGEFDWSAPDEELHRFHNEQTRELGAHLLGRRLYETMVYWETDDESWGPVQREFADIWRPLPKFVFSTTLEDLEGNATLVRGDIAEEVAQIKEQTDGDIGAGGAGLAASLIELDLIDEFRPFVYPVVVGGGTPFLPRLDERIDLELVETRTFGSRVVYMRYRRR